LGVIIAEHSPIDYYTFINTILQIFVPFMCEKSLKLGLFDEKNRLLRNNAQ